jgi:hypothetical protein
MPKSWTSKNQWDFKLRILLISIALNSSAMVKRFYSFLCGDIPAKFHSDFSLSASVARLREGSKRSVFFELLCQAVVGRVTESNVRLQRVIPLCGRRNLRSFLLVAIAEGYDIPGSGYSAGVEQGTSNPPIKQTRWSAPPFSSLCSHFIK